MKNTKIEWAHHTANFWWGCEKVSGACAHCYAESLAKVYSRKQATWGADGARWLRAEAAKKEVVKLDAAARARGVRERLFVNSMSDTFEDRNDLNEARALLWHVCEHVTHLDVILLTKRPENVGSMVPMSWLCGRWPAHVWIGTTMEDQQTAETRLPWLLKVPAAVRLISCEPLLGAVDLASLCATPTDGYGSMPGIHWVIVGGESGPRARPMAAEWVYSLQLQCRRARVPFFFKQWGEWIDVTGNAEPSDTPVWWRGEITALARRVGKEEAGRLLDGAEYSALPEVVAA